MGRERVFVNLLLVLALLAPLGAAPKPYRILISNDDGVQAAGIAALAQTLQAIGGVIVVAPSENHSGPGTPS